MLDTRDFRLALRTLRRHPWYALAGIVVLALGIGSATASFSLLYGVVLAPLEFDREARVVAFWSGGNWSQAEFEVVQDRARSLEALAAYSSGGRRLMDSVDGSEAVNVATATSDFFSVFDAGANLGRTFQEGDGEVGAVPTAVLSDGFWRRRFGGDASILGASLSLDGVSHTVVGVMPAGFWFPSTEVEVWVPSEVDRSSSSFRFNHFLHVVGRVRPGTSVALAREEATPLSAGLVAEFEYGERFSKADGAAIVPLRTQLVGDTRQSLLVLLGGVACLLLISCVNVAGLQINRMASRLHERSVRVALGASRIRIVREHLAESLTLALLGGLTGILVADGMLRVATSVLPVDTPRIDGIELDGTALLWAFGTSLVAAVAVGVAPAVLATRTDVSGALGTARGTETKGAGRLRRGLVVGETALSVVLVLAAGLLARSFAGLLQIDPGFRSESVLALELVAPSAYPGSARNDVFEQATERLAGLPMVVSTGGVQLLPLSPGWSFTVEAEGSPLTVEAGAAPWRAVLPGYFETLGISVLRGRAFESSDGAGAPPVAVVNERFAATYWPNLDPIGRRVRTALPDSEWLTVVGVAENSKVTGLTDDVPSTFYQPYAQRPFGTSMHVVIRTEGDPLPMIDAARRLVAEVDPRLVISTVQTMSDVVSRTMRQPRGLTLLLSGLALTSLLLGAVGLFSLTSQTVASRTKEIGLRMTLGARRGGVVRLVIKEGLLLGAVGIGAGLGLSLAVARSLEGSLYGVASTDATTWMVVIVGFVFVSLLASALPAFRAGRVDPISALRKE